MSHSGWLKDTTALVTGGGAGLGAAIVARYLHEGARVLAFDRDAEKLATVRRAAEAAGFADHLLTYAGDVTSPADNHAAVALILDTWGKLDTLVANAGIWDWHRSVTKLDGEELAKVFDEVFAINVKGYLLAVEAAWRPLIEAQGNIIFTLSNASFYTNGGGPIYTASKHAALGLMRELAYELAPKVRVNAVAPGGMRTSLSGPGSLGLDDRSIADSFAKAEAAGAPKIIPLHQSSVEPEDFTGPYVLLASAANSGPMTGSVINIDGGIGVRGFRTPAGGDDL